MDEILKSARELTDITSKVFDLSKSERELIKRGKTERKKIEEWFKNHGSRQEIKKLIEQCLDKETYRGLRNVLYCNHRMIDYRLLLTELEAEFLKEKGISIGNSFK